MEDISFESLIDSGNKAQIEKLNANKHKNGLGHMPIGYLLNLLSKQSFKLANEIRFEYDSLSKDFKIKGKVRYKIIRGIAANIANYAHLIIVNCDQKIDDNEKEKG